MTRTTATGAVRITRRMPALRFLARAGFAVNGVVHAVIGYLAIRVAAGSYLKADPEGAFDQIASTPGGWFLLWGVAIGLAALGLWLILGSFLIRVRDTKRRALQMAIEIGKGLAYFALAVGAFGFVLGSATRSRGEPSPSAELMASPIGLFVILVIGLGVIAVGVYFVTKGVQRGFVDDIDIPSGRVGHAVVALGVWGYASKGVALATVGVLFTAAAVTTDEGAALGLDEGLRALLALPLGPAIVGAVGAGFIAYGIYCLVRARRAKLD